MLNVRVTTGHRPAQAQEESAGWERLSSFYLKSQKLFDEIELKFLNFRVLDGGFVLDVQKGLGFKRI